ncbi:hypothetical protein M422DRAFT_178298 [Sphaerobolus stellatus SS14]|uniref:Uncharacterized protein n=1 Tax=Sphaerobolus stellatus (strain SS14) TaxID=990650 RepID=A0A0C9UR80_SPHS4|nr:hypothetical protein M422DRAFT_178298 [Sphaerobolus stellatus SS14]
MLTPTYHAPIAQSQYAAAAKVPLIKSPSLRVPPPVQLPPDIHPLPDDVTAYFVYPFTLEPHILTLESSRQATLAAHASRRDAYLRSRQDEKERRKREALRRIAPGFEPSGTPLVPTRVGSSSQSQAQRTNPNGHARTRNVMDDLVDQLEAMEANSVKASSSSRPQSQAQHYQPSKPQSPPQSPPRVVSAASPHYPPPPHGYTASHAILSPASLSSTPIQPQVHAQIPLSAPAPVSGSGVPPPIVGSPPNTNASPYVAQGHYDYQRPTSYVSSPPNIVPSPLQQTLPAYTGQGHYQQPTYAHPTQ